MYNNNTDPLITPYHNNNQRQNNNNNVNTSGNTTPYTYNGSNDNDESCTFRYPPVHSIADSKSRSIENRQEELNTHGHELTQDFYNVNRHMLAQLRNAEERQDSVTVKRITSLLHLLLESLTEKISDRKRELEQQLLPSCGTVTLNGFSATLVINLLLQIDKQHETIDKQHEAEDQLYGLTDGLKEKLTISETNHSQELNKIRTNNETIQQQLIAELKSKNDELSLSKETNNMLDKKLNSTWLQANTQTNELSRARVALKSEQKKVAEAIAKQQADNELAELLKEEKKSMETQVNIYKERVKKDAEAKHIVRRRHGLYMKNINVNSMKRGKRYPMQILHWKISREKISLNSRGSRLHFVRPRIWR